MQHTIFYCIINSISEVLVLVIKMKVIQDELPIVQYPTHLPISGEKMNKMKISKK